MKIPILYEDEALLVCVKPQGVPTQADKSNDGDVLNYFKSYIYDKEELEEEPYLAVVHRLDRPVGGILVLAKTQQAAAVLSDQVQDGTMIKYYQAILTGELNSESGTLEDYLLKDGRTNTTRVVPKGTKGAKKGVLDYEVLDVLETEEGILSYVLIQLRTGRHHQIRVQMANQGAGIWGDTKYNPRFQKVKRRYQQIGLYATRLEFEHPVTGEHLIFKNEPEGEAFEIIEMEDF
ncbi:MAG: RluA family pseudouridine synthase [Bacteroides sp.]|nr:RluA family pseudouridine synthase [Bacteroides sp.]MCM1549511.1 RluA family pseudouridine synthase [Clostridium sp.]